MSRGQDKNSFSERPRKQPCAYGCFNGQKILTRQLMQDGELFIREPCRTSASLRLARTIKNKQKDKG